MDKELTKEQKRLLGVAQILVFAELASRTNILADFEMPGLVSSSLHALDVTPTEMLTAMEINKVLRGGQVETIKTKDLRKFLLSNRKSQVANNN